MLDMSLTVNDERTETLADYSKRLKKRRQKNANNQKIKMFLIGALSLLLAIGSFAAYKFWEKEVFLADGDQAINVESFVSNVDELLKERGIQLDPEDIIEPSLATQLQDGLQIKITRAIEVPITFQGQTKIVRHVPASVGDFLTLAGIELGPLDKVVPAVDAKIEKPQGIRVVKVSQETTFDEQKIPFRTESKPDSRIEKGLKRTLVRGQEGLGRNHILITFEDGVETGREIIAQEIVREPKTQVIAMGTIDTVSRGGTHFQFKEAREVVATAYTYTGRRTASGSWPEVGTIAADPTVIPMGSKVYVEGYGFAQVKDVGSAIRGDRIDVFLETPEECRRWGKKSLKIYVLD